MTETDWLSSTDPVPLLRHLGGKVSQRKLRLFAVACCRQLWPVLEGGERQAVEAAERYADGQADADELRRACEGGDYPTARARLDAEAAGLVPRAYAPIEMAYLADFHYLPRVSDALAIAARDAAGAASVSSTAESAVQAALLRDLCGNPFRSPPVVDPAWLAWQDGVARRLVEAIYEQRAFERLPILADALEEAGCAERALLDHCRGPGPHGRGCHVLDALLDRHWG
jgi:hypothetical protein